MKLFSRSYVRVLVATLVVLAVAMMTVSVGAVSSSSSAFVQILPLEALVVIGVFSVASTLLMLLQEIANRRAE